MTNCNNVVSGIQKIWVGSEAFPITTKCIICKEETEWVSHQTVCISCKRQFKLNEVLGIENKIIGTYMFEQFEQSKKDKNSHIPSNIQNRLKRRNK